MALKNADLPDLRQFNTFLMIVEHRSFSAAARQLEISQPSVSQQMKKLEEHVGRPLFDRQGTQFALTSDGEALLVFARALISLSEQVRAHFADPGFSGCVRLGFNEDFAVTVLPKVLFLFMRMHANFQLVVQCSFDSAALFKALDDGELDLVVAKLPPTMVRGEVLHRDKMVWFGQSSDMKVEQDPVPLIISTAPRGRREIMFRALAEAGRSWQIVFRSPNLAVLDAAITAGIGVSASMKGFKPGFAQELEPTCGLPPLDEIALCLDAGGNDTSSTVAMFASFLKQSILGLDIGPPCMEP